MYFYRCGYNQWRDPMKPVQLLTKLCKEGKLDGPHFSDGKVRVGEKTFTLQKESVNSKSSHQYSDQHNAKSMQHCVQHILKYYVNYLTLQ